MLRKNLDSMHSESPQATCSPVISSDRWPISERVLTPAFPFLLVDDISERRSLVITYIFQSFALMPFFFFFLPRLVVVVW